MAIQKGFLNLVGTLGDTTFAQTKDGFQARTKTRLSAAQVKTSPAFARTRENNTEFGRAGQAGKLLRDAVSQLLDTADDPNTIGRLVKRMMQVIKSDTTSSRGKRNVMDGNLSVLNKFEFNVSAVMEKVVRVGQSSTINRVTGELTVNLPSFQPEFSFKAPAGATHYRLVSAGTELDFEQNIYKKDVKLGATLPLDRTATVAGSIVHTLTPNSTLPLVQVFGAQFFQQVGPDMLPLLKGSANVLSVINVSKV